MQIQNNSKEDRAKKILEYLKKAYPNPKTELNYSNDFQCLVAVILSAQYTDKKVNELTKILFKKYKNIDDFARVPIEIFAQDIKTVSYFNNKAKSIVNSAKNILEKFGGQMPDNLEDLQTLPGVGYKTANVILGEIFDKWEGIAVDTHVRRFALRFGLTKNTIPDKIAKDLEELFPKKDWKYINNGFVLYGRYVCPARIHDCSEHPLTKLIPSAENIWPKSK